MTVEEKRSQVALRIEVDMAIYTAHLGFTMAAESLLKRHGFLDKAIHRLLHEPFNRRQKVNRFILDVGKS